MSDHDTGLPPPGGPGDAATEVGAVLMGLAAERLLAGLGAARPTDDTGSAVLEADLFGDEEPDAVAQGAERWFAARDTLAATDPGGLRAAALRRLWADANRTVAAATLVDPGLATLGDTERAYLAACWLRRAEVDLRSEEFHAPPDIAP